MNIIKQCINEIIKIIEIIINYLIFRFYKVRFVSFPNVKGIVYIRNNGQIFIDSDVNINSKRSANPIGGDTRTILFCKDNASIKIGKGTGISNSCLYATDRITIGNFVKIGGGCKIYDSDFHSLDITNRIKDLDDPDVASKPVVINDNAFIGAHCIILKGVCIGKNSIVGAGSVVTKSVPKNQIWAGNPAKFIKNIEDTSNGN